MVFRKNPGTGKSPGKKSHPYFDYSRTRELGNSLASKFLVDEEVPRWRGSSSLASKFLVGEEVPRWRETYSLATKLLDSSWASKLLGNSLASKFLVDEEVPRWRESSSLASKFLVDEFLN